MDAVGESSLGEKPVIVRVKRKAGHSPLDAFWLEINERPFKRLFQDLSKLSISNSEEKEDLKPKKVLVRHLETVTNSETPLDVIHSLFESDVNEPSSSKGKIAERKIAFKKDNRKEQLMSKAVQQQKIAAENARFEQIWRSRKGDKEDVHDKKLHEKCNFYDVIRVDAEEIPKNEPEFTSLEEQQLMANFLPLLRECIPTAAEEIEADILSSHTEEYVYDYYAVNEEMDTSEDTTEYLFPLVKVEDEDDFCYGSDESHYESDDSNAEDHPNNDYPEEMSEEEEEEEENEDEEDEDEDEDEEEEESGTSDESEDAETSARHVRRVLGDDEYDDYGEDVDCDRESDEEFEYSKWSYRG